MKNLNNIKKIIVLLLLQLVSITIFGQNSDSQKDNWNVLLLKKGNQLETKENMSSLSKTGFYLYKNCIYDITLRNEKGFEEKKIGGRLINIKPDSLIFTNYFNLNAAFSNNAKLDTFAVHYEELDQLKIISDRSLGLYEKISFDNYDFVFKKDTVNYAFKRDWVKIYTNDVMLYEVVAHMTAQGIGALYEQDGRTYFFEGTGLIKPAPPAKDNTYNVRNIIGFTPSNSEEINGIAFGVWTKNMKNSQLNLRDSLVIRGLNIEINPMSIFMIMMGNTQTTGRCADDLDYYYKVLKKDWYVKISGVHINPLTTINEITIKGLNITGLITVADEIHGVTISGVNNFAYIMNGLSISGIRNRATLAKGVQIGLFNKATELRGFQFGLWNINGKRSLPFINWQFKPKRKK